MAVSSFNTVAGGGAAGAAIAFTGSGQVAANLEPGVYKFESPSSFRLNGEFFTPGSYVRSFSTSISSITLSRTGLEFERATNFLSGLSDGDLQPVQYLSGRNEFWRRWNQGQNTTETVYVSTNAFSWFSTVYNFNFSSSSGSLWTGSRTLIRMNNSIIAFSSSGSDPDRIAWSTNNGSSWFATGQFTAPYQDGRSWAITPRHFFIVGGTGQSSPYPKRLWINSNINNPRSGSMIEPTQWTTSERIASVGWQGDGLNENINIISGTQGNILLSTGGSWIHPTSLPFTNSRGDTAFQAGIVPFGTGGFIAASYDRIWLSTDAWTNWTTATGYGTNAQFATGSLTYNATGGFYAIVSTGSIFQSTDGANWSLAETYGSTGGMAYTQTNGITLVRAGSGASFRYLFSTNGTTWINQLPLTGGQASAASSTLLMKASSTQIIISTNGSSWNYPTIPFSSVQSGPFVANNRFFYSYDNNGNISSSTNGTSWTNSSISGAPAGSSRLRGVAFATSTFVAAVGTMLVMSTNGTSWTIMSTAPSSFIGIAGGQDGFIASFTTSWSTGAGTVINTSNDGISWSRYYAPGLITFLENAGNDFVMQISVQNDPFFRTVQSNKLAGILSPSKIGESLVLFSTNPNTKAAFGSGFFAKHDNSSISSIVFGGSISSLDGAIIPPNAANGAGVSYFNDKFYALFSNGIIATLNPVGESTLIIEKIGN